MTDIADTLDCTKEDLALLTDSERFFLRSSYESIPVEGKPTRETMCRGAHFLVDIKKRLPDVVADMIAEDNNGNVYVHWRTLFAFLDGKTGKFTFRKEDRYGEGTGDLLGEFENLTEAVKFAVEYLRKSHVTKSKSPQQSLSDPVPNFPLMKSVVPQHASHMPQQTVDGPVLDVSFMKCVAPSYPQATEVFNVLLKQVEERSSGAYFVGDEDDEKIIVEDIAKLNTFFMKHHLAKLASSTSDDDEYTLHLVRLPEDTTVDPRMLCEFAFEFLVLPRVDDDEMFHKEIMHFNTLLDSYDLKFAMLPLYKHDVKFIRYE